MIPRLRTRIPAFRNADADTTAALRPGSILVINLGKNKTSALESSHDFVTGVKSFGPYADVLVVDVSSPNTPRLRCVQWSSYFCLGLLMSVSGLQNRETLESLLADVTKAHDELEPSPITSHRPRLVLKIAPDLQENQVIEMAEVIKNSAIDGVIVSNTTVTRPSSLIDREHLSFSTGTVVDRICESQPTSQRWAASRGNR